MARFEASGWTRLPAVRDRLTMDPQRFLVQQGPRWWRQVQELGEQLGQWLAGTRFAEDTELGLLFVPAAVSLDTRAPMAVSLRRRQHDSLTEDVFDERLDTGVDLVPDGAEGAFFVTCVGRYGLSLGSYREICSVGESDCTVADTDVRVGMTRQLWGARVLQAGDVFLPDSDFNDRWTFTLFAGDDLVDDLAQSGTVLKSRVRYRLGKPDRGIGSARVAPALLVGS